MKILKVILLFICLLPTVCFADIIKSDTMLGLTRESHYQEKWCAGVGETEVVLLDRTRCDCLTERFAIEFDFGAKWYEGIMQALHYSDLTGKNPGLVLILKKESDIKYYNRALNIINKRNLPVQVWIIKAY